MSQTDNLPSNIVQETTDYDQFHMMDANRETSRGHIEMLKGEFEKRGNLTRVQPILVNENFFIVDGQHRFMAAKELNEPVYFTQVPGLTVGDARAMNATHRPWSVDDYARSYAYTGRKPYQRYLQLRETYEIGHSITLIFIYHGESEGAFKDFRNGGLVIPDEQLTVSKLDKMSELQEVLPFKINREEASALQRIFNHPNYSQKRMVAKAQALADQYIRHFASEGEYLRAFEEMYNHNQGDDTRVRFF